ncbi:MAG: recombinase family protein [Magnetococcales bacterium]|nr:recombinase family protein [Magnetococcales bacterium]
MPVDKMQGILPLPIRAAQYVRTATERLNGSTDHKQSAAIREFAARNGFEIVRTYADIGKGGLSMDGRNGLQQMLQDITSGVADYMVVLAYDISRWGRAEEIIHRCETVCSQHGIRVEYCADHPVGDIPFSSLYRSWLQPRAEADNPEISKQAHDFEIREEPVAHG